MPIEYNMGNNPIWAFLDPSGKPAVGYVWETWRDSARDEPKLVYQDSLGNFPYPQKIQLNAAGQVAINPIFFADDEAYYITVTGPGSSEPLYSFEGYQPNGGGGGGTEIISLKNHIVNGQFSFSVVPSLPSLPSGTISIGPGWEFSKNTATAVDTLSLIKFAPGQTAVTEGNPFQYISYSCTSAGSGETSKFFRQKFPGVISFENKMISLQFQGVSTLASIITVSFVQNFGTGGSPTITTPFIGSPVTLSNTFDKYELSLNVPSTGGNTIGSAGDDFAAIVINLPLNAVSNVGLVNVQIIEGDIQPEYDYNTYNVDLSRSYTSQYTVPDAETTYLTSVGLSDLYRPVLYNGNNSFSYLDALPVGARVDIIWDPTVITEGSSLFPKSFLLADGRSLDPYSNNYIYRRLASYVGTAFGFGNDGLSVVFNSAGTVRFQNMTSGSVPIWTDVSTGFTITRFSSSPNVITQIVCVSGASLTAGSYFLAYGVSAQWYVWIIKDFIGVDPKIPGKIGIPLSVLSSDSATVVANRLDSQLRVARFTLPNINNGIFIRYGVPGFTPTYDPDFTTRLPYGANLPGGYVIGSLQNSQNISHLHSISNDPGAFALKLGTANFQSGTSLNYEAAALAANTGVTGGNQSNPNNMLLASLIKY